MADDHSTDPPALVVLEGGKDPQALSERARRLLTVSARSLDEHGQTGVVSRETPPPYVQELVDVGFLEVEGAIGTLSRSEGEPVGMVRYAFTERGLAYLRTHGADTVAAEDRERSRN